jgi:integrase
MTEYIFKPSRIVAGKRVKARCFRGRYSLGRGLKMVTVSLDTPDRDIAKKRLRDIIVAKQRELEGLSPKASTTLPISELLRRYAADLASRITAKHTKGTVNRIKRALAGTGWVWLADVAPSSWVAWRSTLTVSAKTVKEYQVSMQAFMNWLVRMDCAERNPLQKVDKIETRGKMVRPVRSFTDDELRRLLEVAGRRRPAYLVLLYTGLRKREVKRLLWGDLKLDDAKPYLLAREGTTKNKRKRAIPLHPGLVEVLRKLRPSDAADDQVVFHGIFPKRGSLLRDFKRAKIERVDAAGRVVHFHAFRKTFQTLGVRHGINQRSAQELLGHSDPRLTANVYTDVPALGLHAEVSKLPWLGDNAPSDAQTDVRAPVRARLLEIFSKLEKLVQDADVPLPSEAAAPAKMVEVAGVEPACP